jgi:hypothetical protein
MESIELFDENFYGARDEMEFLSIMASLGWMSGDISKMDYPKSYPCLFRVLDQRNPNGRDWVDVYHYYEADIRDIAAKIQDLF